MFASLDRGPCRTLSDIVCTARAEGRKSHLSEIQQIIRPQSPPPLQTGPPPCRGLLRGIASPAVLGHKEPARASKAPIRELVGGF